MKTISILFALVNSLAAGLVIAASLPAIQILHPAASLWNMTKVSASIVVIAAGILTWIAASRATNPNLMIVAGLFLVVLGTASAVWTIHLALISGDIKDHMFLFGGSLMAQGASSIWNLLLEGRLINTT
ncbi:MAG TPA: hypothetical protein VHM28_09615 [Anaerolineales bacterium]|jgi:hypothetical protein|nr:hypothetical protein [Anaerolineales bacterium]